MPEFHTAFHNLRDLKLNEVPKDQPRLKQHEPLGMYAKHSDRLIYVNEIEQTRSENMLKNWETDHHNTVWKMKVITDG